MEKKFEQGDDMHSIPMTSVSSGKEREVAEDVCYYTDQIVNLVFVGKPGSRQWFLIDAGMPNSAHDIKKIADKRFGENVKPSAIFLTHGHFDHVGSLVDLMELWPDVTVYAHQMEFPYLSGQKDYPDPDITVEGGMLAKISMIYPHKAINVSPVLRHLSSDGFIPGHSEWRWIHTPGHSPGHVSFFRERDGLLIAGDAFVTVRQDSFYKVLIQKKEVHGPPRYLTTDWKAAKDSVIALTRLNPKIAVTGHGTHMEGEELSDGLRRLCDKFEELAVPDHGRFVDGDK